MRTRTSWTRPIAPEFAKNAGAKVGKIRSAYQGGFTVEDSSSDNSGSSIITKEVRVVTTIDFYLTDCSFRPCLSRRR